MKTKEYLKMNYFTILNHQDLFCVLNNSMSITGQKQLFWMVIIWEEFRIMKCWSAVKLFI